MYTLGLNSVKQLINSYFKSKEPWQIVAITSTTILTSIWLWNFIFQDESLTERAKKKLFNLMHFIPAIRNKIDQELDNINQIFEKETLQRLKKVPFVVKLPEKGLKPKEVLERVKQCVQLGDYNWKDGKVSGAIYRVDINLLQLMGDIYSIASYTNPLHPDVFPGICKMEAEVVKIACNLFHGDNASCGTMTSGGTESILLACKTYRDYARHVKGIKNPEIIMPVTAHSAFDKAAQYLKLKVRSVPVDQHSYTVCIKSMEKAITRNTIMLVGSAPNFPYGTMDNIQAISDLGVKYNIPVHVDACLGGFLICFMKNAGFDISPFDFKLSGVTSISADTHKYAYAPKGSSLILYRNKKIRHYQYTITTDWPGGIYGSPTVSGSRAGGVIASCWATLMYFGYNEYLESTKKIIKTTRYIEQRLRKLKGIFIFGTPATSVIALGSNDFHIYKLSEALNAKGWNLNTLQFPCGIHLCVTYVHTQSGVADQFLSDVETELEEILKNPETPVEGKFAIYGMSQSIPDRSIVGDFAKCFLDSMYFTPENETISNGPNI
ncbi:sphingosine-1-phosphate lyase [Apis mellifera caucasica]|uniref:sphinganine-1-phosphate aldolase n=1 Tax=Apis mellifera TaxID=7460 RepID=A0A7M7GS11_APIME|nr:sphingosine-1-phosphate lyase [Apis mellifera]XP_623988.1 sphingosine-1-phosphate lyase [Apis mellifera]KAG6800804.1 sphingosine-1-phosphate lyase [Apis mellifera caucasica]KAG9428473.1 sphingosine-1-phosphate lyase [Apis mellifera carnica]|eukprot:XP_006563709.1 sphingosine-1-phosphate lyase [Apis mellifera]